MVRKPVRLPHLRAKTGSVPCFHGVRGHHPATTRAGAPFPPRRAYGAKGDNPDPRGRVPGRDSTTPPTVPSAAVRCATAHLGRSAGVNVSRSPALSSEKGRMPAGNRRPPGAFPRAGTTSGARSRRGTASLGHFWTRCGPLLAARSVPLRDTSRREQLRKTPNAMPTLRRASRRASEFVFTPSRGQLASARGCALSYPSRRRPLVRCVYTCVELSDW